MESCCIFSRIANISAVSRFSDIYLLTFLFCRTSIQASTIGDASFYMQCEDTLPPLNFLDFQSEEKRFSLRDWHRLGNDPHWVPSFLSRRPRMSPERLRNKSEPVGSEEIVKLWQSTQNTRLRPTEFSWEFFNYPHFDFFRNLGNVFLSRFWIKCVLRLNLLCIFRCFSRNCC